LGKPRIAAETIERGKRKARSSRDYDQILFDRLRALRKQLADAAHLPPFVVFSDATLAEMARVLPQDAEELLQVSGVGEHKLQKYGVRFLYEIRRYQAEKHDIHLAA
jgi:ATP-dependent DNA helicase RecQ